jgi:hypothetical protein
MTTDTQPAATVYQNFQRGYVQPRCECGWKGVARSLRGTIEVHDLAARDAKDHTYRHANGLGWFDYEKGWQQP